MKNLTWAILVAAGRDEQIASSVSTPFLFLNDRPVIAYVLSALEQAPEISGVVVVVDRENAHELLAMMKTYRFSKIQKIVGGGARRSTSMAAGLEYIDPNADFVCVADPSRPLVTSALISETVKAAWRGTGGIATAGEELIDPIALVKKNVFQERIKPGGSHLWSLVSPQVFPREVLVEAFAKLKKAATDDLEVVAAVAPKLVPRVVPAPPACHVGVRIRSVDDLATATAFLRDPNRL